MVMDLVAFDILGEVQLDSPFTVVDVTPDGEHLILSNIPTNDWQEVFYNPQQCSVSNAYGIPAGSSGCEVAIVDLATNEVWVEHFPFAIRDIDFSPARPDVLFTYSRWVGNQPVATVDFYSPASRAFQAKLDFSNCADELVVDPASDLAILAPTSCNKDPISIIDLEQRQFVKNLPGFGPVLISRDGSTAVGFTRKENMEQEWDYFDQQLKVGLIVVDLATLVWKIVDHGDKEPAYTISPNGKHLYLYHDQYSWEKNSEGKFEMVPVSPGLSQIDLADMKVHRMAHDGFNLDRFVWSKDGHQMYVLSNGELLTLEVGIPQLELLPLSAQPELINIRPQDDLLTLGEGNAPVFYLFEMASGSVEQQINLKLDALEPVHAD